MILPSKHIKTDRALLSIGAEVLRLLGQPKTISKLWDEFRNMHQLSRGKAPVTYDWFILAIDLLYMVGAVSFERGLLRKSMA